MSLENKSRNIIRSGVDPYQTLITIGVGVLASLLAWALTQNFKIVFTSLFLFIIAFIIFIFIYKKAKTLITFKKCGIVNVHTNQYAAETSIREKLSSANSIDILTIRGLGIFALKDSLIRKILVERADQIKVRVLFLNPDSQYVARRAGEVGESAKAFRQGILLCQGYLTELKIQHKVHIEAYMYDTLPVWRLKFMDSALYVSSFQPSKEGHHSAMYELVANGDFSLYNSFRREFEYLITISKKYL